MEMLSMAFDYQAVLSESFEARNFQGFEVSVDDFHRLHRLLRRLINQNVGQQKFFDELRLETLKAHHFFVKQKQQVFDLNPIVVYL